MARLRRLINGRFMRLEIDRFLRQRDSRQDWVLASQFVSMIT